MAGPEDFPKRLFDAWLRLQQMEGRSVSQRELGERVSATMQRASALHPTAVNKWFKDGTIPDPLTVVALAEVLRAGRAREICDPGWLVFGEESGAPAPRDAAGEATEAMIQPEED